MMWFGRLPRLLPPSLPGASAAPRAAIAASRCLAAASSAAAAHASEWLSQNAGFVFAGGLALGAAASAGAGAAWQHLQDQDINDDSTLQQQLPDAPSEGRGGAASTSAPGRLSEVPWVQDLSSAPDVKEVLSAGQMLRRHPLGKVVLRQDHLFDALILGGQVEEMRCFYDPTSLKFHCVLRLGRDVCGYPRTVHGGLTAAIVDETFGGLSLSMWQGGKLGVQAPGYTARLELDYKLKIPSDSVMLCTCEVEKKEDRKLWMRATVSDGRGVVYSTARALFVAPKIRNVLFGWVPAWARGGGRRGGSGGVKAEREERGR